MKPDLQYLALQIYELCIRYSIIIELEWIPRDLNVQADFYSKIFDFDDWSVAPHTCSLFFNQKWGPFSIDTPNTFGLSGVKSLANLQGDRSSNCTFIEVCPFLAAIVGF
jgi:hypothetical protein